MKCLRLRVPVLDGCGVSVALRTVPRLRAVARRQLTIEAEGGKARETPSKWITPVPVVTEISSLSNPYVKHCVKLRTSGGYRKDAGTVLVVGRVLVDEILSGEEKYRNAPKVILLAEGAHDDFDFPSAKVIRVTKDVLRKVSGVQNVDNLDAIAEFEIPRVMEMSSLCSEVSPIAKMRRVLAMEGVQDPGNLGTLLRSALALGWDAVALLPGCCDPFNDKALRAGKGAAFRMPLILLDWEALLEAAEYHDMKLLAAHPSAESSNWSDRTDMQRVVLVLGSEGQGLSRIALQSCMPISIPMAGEMESLNVAVAGGILLYILQRERCTDDV